MVLFRRFLKGTAYKIPQLSDSINVDGILLNLLGLLNENSLHYPNLNRLSFERCFMMKGEHNFQIRNVCGLLTVNSSTKLCFSFFIEMKNF